jgi:mono/diheme cytochrome c family protein
MKSASLEQSSKTMRVVLLPLLTIVFIASSLYSQSTAPKDSTVTPVTGESWLKHLHKSFDETSMGRTWDTGPAAPLAGDQSPRRQPELTPGFAANVVTLHGSDLFRLNCQGCHGASGGGAPPEINSVINPIRATSVAVILARMKNSGQTVSRADATTLAKQASVLIVDRLHKGGQKMPPFPHLNDGEVQAIIAYLEQLASVPDAEKHQIELKESSYRVGEHIVKSTCHICHSATGPNPTAQQLMNGMIPPLSTLTMRSNMADFVRKVTKGSPDIIGTSSASSNKDSYRGRMPVIRYLSDDEAADAYLYLTIYPPRD